MSYIHRLMEADMAAFASIMRVVMVGGPRQCGKTTLLRHCLAENEPLLSMDDAATRDQAISDPDAFLRSHLQTTSRVALDEVQKAPVLFSQIKYFVDRDPTPGRFLLSGSSNYMSLPTVNESLAGRIGIVRLRTFTAAEINGVDKSRFLADAASGRFGRQHYAPEECSKPVVIARALQGGYPEILNSPAVARRIWFQQYLQVLINRDFAQIRDFRKKSKLPQILQRIASVSSRTINMSEMGRDLGEEGQLVNRYVEALRTMYLVDAVPAWTRKPYARLSKAPKWLITDTGFMSSLLEHFDLEETLAWARQKEKIGTDFIGNLIETWLYTQIAPLAEASHEWSVYHLRVAQRQAIDFLLENGRGEMIAVEVKSAESVNNKDFTNLRWFKDLNGEAVLASIVFYCGQDVRDFGNGCWAVPMAALWTEG